MLRKTVPKKRRSNRKSTTAKTFYVKSGHGNPLKPKIPCREVTLKKIFSISWSKSMESLVGNNKYFKFNPEPVKIRKNRFNMKELGRKSNNTSSCVLHTLELFNHFLR